MIKRISKIFYPPKEGELMVEMLLDCIIFLRLIGIKARLTVFKVRILKNELR